MKKFRLIMIAALAILACTGLFACTDSEEIMKDYIEVNEAKCDEAHNCMCTKEVDGKTYCRGCGNVQPEQED